MPMPTPLTISLGWQLGTVPATVADPQTVDVLVRRAGLPQWIEVAGVIYTRTHGSVAGRMREVSDRTPRAEAV